MNVAAKRQAGMTLIEVIAVLAVLVILAGIMLPLSSRTIRASKFLTVHNELQHIQEALDFYYYDKASYPSSLTDTTFLGPYLLAGINNQNISDDLSLTPGNTYQYGKETFSDGTTKNAVVWTVGNDGTNSGSVSGSHPRTLIQDVDGDDFFVRSRSMIPGRRKTRLRLDIVGAALCKYYWDPAYATANTMSAVADWSSTSTTRAALLLLHEFNTDGFGKGLKNTAPPSTGNAYDTPTIYSFGPDQADDSGGDDDITF